MIFQYTDKKKPLVLKKIINFDRGIFLKKNNILIIHQSKNLVVHLKVLKNM